MKDIRFKNYRRTQIAEMREVTPEEIRTKVITTKEGSKVSVSEEDVKNGSPLAGDMVARNPKNHKDQWLVAAEYFKDNFTL